jgi:Sec-independent protein translocase protein TatA
LLSPADLFIAFVAGLLFFGPEGLPQVARKAGKIVRELQDTSQAFIREMERIADIPEAEIPPAGEKPQLPGSSSDPRDSGSSGSH